MGFHDLERSLKEFYREVEKPKVSQITKRKLQFEALEAFRNQKSHHGFSGMVHMWAWFRSWQLRPALAFGLVALLGASFLGNSKPSTLVSLEGLVTVYRDGEAHLVSGSFALEPGDGIETSSSSKSKIIAKGRFEALISPESEVRYTAQRNLFVASGNIQADIFKSGKIVTDRGTVQTNNEGKVRVEVSPTGETLVVLEENQAYVQNWKQEQQTLALGDSVRFRTDTVLADVSLPQNISLSLDQILALRSQFSISRTKAVNALEQLALENPEAAQKQLASAETTFRQVIRVLNSDRNLNAASQKDVNVFSNEDVLVLLKERKVDSVLIDEAQALSQLFTLTQTQEDLFSEEFTGVLTFDRYRMLDRAFALAGDDSGSLGEILKQKYAIAFLQDIQNEEVGTEQKEVLERTLALLPNTITTDEFLARVAEISDPRLAELLKQQRKALFS